MSEPWETLASEVAADGERRHSGWDPELFDSLVRGPGAALWGALQARPRRERVVGAWLKLTAEAVGLGHVDRASAQHLLSGKGAMPDSMTLMARCLLQLSLAQLPAYPEEQAVALLVRTWNLCEGLAGQPVWLNRYVASAAASAPALEKLDAFLTTTLAPALAPVRTSTFSGPFSLAILDTRKVMDEFLPGEMHLAAPMVLCVHDRRDNGVHVGLFLAPQSEARFLGLQPCMGHGPVEVPPALEVTSNTARVNGKEAALPLLGTPHRTLVARSGYVVASAVDSQRLWVLDSP
ncbi:hypothetical protein [Pyxidicoccus xibeiensis]|uniref:hypothetical protein n=1 Tax=Pyxidicoccus xibeiensis TaxID=2906759 RepID=UPI0020A6ED13|nr:hypothetical protein [Pyxidicoccus xibeiensis]MCP3143886.1 hypothetical protein [Pyxidicoccus xibeiensis]